MEHKQPGSPAIRVSIVSGSLNQREHLKRLIEQHGPRVVGTSSFRDFDLSRDELHPDVLLVDLDQADDASLSHIDRLLDQSHVPVLFNESTSIPTTPGPYRDDWIDNLVGKLYNLATHRSLLAKPDRIDRPRYARTVGHALPKVLIVAHSKTRRRVLQIMLAAQGIRDSTETSFEANFIADRIEHYDAVLVDEHNVSPEEQIMFGEITTQTRVPVQVCNSSTIPYSALARQQWGIQLAGKLIKISKFKTIAPPADTTTQTSLNRQTYAPPITFNGEHDWGNRLSAELAQVRNSLTHQAATAKVRISTKPNFNSTQKIEASTTTSSNLPLDTATAPKSAAKAAADTDLAREEGPGTDKTTASPHDSIDTVPVDSLPTTPPAPQSAEVHHNEIESFFDFDKELDISQQNHSLGEGHLLNSATHDEILPWNLDEEPTNPFNNHQPTKSTYRHAQKKQRSSWRDSLNGIRRKLPKLFH